MIKDDLPVLMIKGQSAGAGQNLTNALGVVLGAAAHAASLAQLVEKELLRHLHRKLHVSDMAERRAVFLFGRLRNWMTGNDPNYITMSASHLFQTLQLVGTDARGKLEAGQAYLLRKDAARQAHDTLGAQLGVDPQTLRQGLT